MLAGLTVLILATARTPDPVETVRHLYQANITDAASSLAMDLRPGAGRCPVWIDWVRHRASPDNLRVHELNRSGARNAVVLAQFRQGDENRARRFTLSLQGQEWTVEDAVAVDGQPTLRQTIETCSPDTPRQAPLSKQPN